MERLNEKAKDNPESHGRRLWWHSETEGVFLSNTNGEYVFGRIREVPVDGEVFPPHAL